MHTETITFLFQNSLGEIPEEVSSLSLQAGNQTISKLRYQIRNKAGKINQKLFIVDGFDFGKVQGKKAIEERIVLSDPELTYMWVSPVKI